jgi:hypothetical protein
VTNINHIDNKTMMGEIAPQKNRKMHVSWTEANAKFAGKERLFDMIIDRAKAFDANDLRRDTETEIILQRKRGNTTEHKPAVVTNNNKSVISNSGVARTHVASLAKSSGTNLF